MKRITEMDTAASVKNNKNREIYQFSSLHKQYTMEMVNKKKNVGEKFQKKQENSL